MDRITHAPDWGTGLKGDRRVLQTEGFTSTAMPWASCARVISLTAVAPGFGGHLWHSSGVGSPPCLCLVSGSNTRCQDFSHELRAAGVKNSKSKNKTIKIPPNKPEVFLEGDARSIFWCSLCFARGCDVGEFGRGA